MMSGKKLDLGEWDDIFSGVEDEDQTDGVTDQPVSMINQTQSTKKRNKQDKTSKPSTKKKQIEKHHLTKTNLLRFIMEQERTKLYEMKIRFYQNSSNEINALVQECFNQELLIKNKNGWISIHPDKKDKIIKIIEGDTQDVK